MSILTIFNVSRMDYAFIDAQNISQEKVFIHSIINNFNLQMLKIEIILDYKPTNRKWVFPFVFWNLKVVFEIFTNEIIR